MGEKSALGRSETQNASSRIWIRVTDSISNDDNRYAKHAVQFCPD